jgi:hypothetical protein
MSLLSNIASPLLRDIVAAPFAPVKIDLWKCASQWLPIGLALPIIPKCQECLRRNHASTGKIARDAAIAALTSVAPSASLALAGNANPADH